MEAPIDNEINIMHGIARNNSYKESITNKSIKSMSNKKSNFKLQNSKLSSLQYFSSSFGSLKYKFNKYNVSIVAKPSVKHKNILCKKMDPIEWKQLSGVCKTSFAKEDGIVQFYIEITTRKLETVFKNHIAYIEYNKKITDLARLYRNKYLQIDF